LSHKGRNLGFLLNLGEFRFKLWLSNNALTCLKEVGVHEGQTVLDVGSSSGTFTIPAATLVGENGMVYALDIDQGALEKLRKRAEAAGLKNIRTFLSSADDKIKLDDGSVDHILLMDVLQELSNRDQILSEARRVLRAGGLATVFPMHMDYDGVIRWLSRRI